MSHSQSHLLSWLSLLVFTFQSTHIHAITTAEYDSLISLYNSTSGSSWNTPWNLSTDPCSWYGIRCGTPNAVDVSLDTIAQNEQFCTWNGINGNCTHTNYHITQIYLQNQKLNGTLPLSAISGLNWLFVLWIIDAPLLTGTLPPFTTHPYLTNLKLMNTGLSGEFPAINARHTNITLEFLAREIIVENSGFTGIAETATQPGNAWGFQNILFANVPIQNTTRFFAMIPNTTVDLTCRGCSLTGPIPALSPGHLSVLKSITLYANALTGSFLHLVPNTTVLTHLQLDFNQLSGELGVIPGTTLETFSITANKFTGPHPILDTHTQLTQINLVQNQFTTFANQLPFPKLHTYNIHTNLITGSLPHYFSQPGYLPAMQSFLALRNHINGTVPTFAAFGNKFDSLYLSDNELTGSLPIDQLCTRFPALSIIKFGGNRFQGTLPDLINCTSLNEIEISRNLLNGTLPTTLPSKLRTLDISNNFFTGNVYNYTGNIQLNIACNALSPPLPLSSLFDSLSSDCYNGIMDVKTCPSCIRPNGLFPTATPTTSTPTTNAPTTPNDGTNTTTTTTTPPQTTTPPTTTVTPTPPSTPTPTRPPSAAIATAQVSVYIMLLLSIAVISVMMLF